MGLHQIDIAGDSLPDGADFLLLLFDCLQLSTLRGRAQLTSRQHRQYHQHTPYGSSKRKM